MYAEATVGRGPTNMHRHQQQQQQGHEVHVGCVSNNHHHILPVQSSAILTSKPVWIGGMSQHNSLAVPPEPFPEPAFAPGRREASQFPSDLNNRGFMLMSEASGRRWHAVGSVRVCGFGEVFRAVELVVLPSGEWGHEHSYFAVKEMKLDKIREIQGRSNEEPLKEVSVMQHLARSGIHPNVISCTEVLHDSSSIYVVMPFCEGGELFDHVTAKQRLKETEARPLFRQVLEGVGFLQQHGVCHRDLSLENLLLTDNGEVRIIDFGMALKVPRGRDGHAGLMLPQGPCGKANYMTPEILLSERAFDGFKIDIWACGIILFIMLTGKPPFEVPLPGQDARCRVISVEKRLVDVVRHWNMDMSPEAVDLIQSCLLYEPSQRPTIDQLRAHPWLWLNS